MVLLIGIIILSTILKSQIHSLNFNNCSLVTNKENFTSKVYSVLKPFQTFCVITSLDFGDFLDFILNLESIISSDKYIFSENVTIPNDCDYFLVLEMPDFIVCNMFLRNKTKYLNLSNFVIILNSTFVVNMDILNHCSSVFNSANVALISLQNDHIFLLSSPLISPRRFIFIIPQEFFLHALNISNPSFQGSTINVLTFHHPPFSIIRKINNSVDYSGIEIDFFKVLASHLNLTWKIVNLKSGEVWGSALQNGTMVGGVIQALRDGDADMVICNLWQRDNYIDDVEFGPPLNMIYLAFIVRRPYQLNSRWQAFTQIFTVDVWATTFVAFLAVTLVFCLAYNITSSTSQMSVAESCLVVFGILIGSVSYISNRRLTAFNTRFIIIWWFFFSIIFITALTSSIVTQLTLPLYSPRMDSIKQLVQNDYYWTDTLYSNRSNTLKSFYFNLNDPWQLLFAARYKHIDPVEMEDYLQTDSKITLPVQLFDEEFVMVSTKQIREEADLRNFRVMREHFKETYTSFGFRKHSPFKELLSRATLRLLDYGIFQYFRRKFIDHDTNRKYLRVETDIRIVRKPEELSLWKLYPIFVVLFLGYVLAGFVFLIELFYFKYYLKI